MKNKKCFSVFLIIILFLINAVGQDKQTNLNEFVGSDWTRVKEAKNQLENLQGDVIPDLMKLLDRTDKVKLLKTGSLIYPGAEKFYGYGQILDYDIDYIAIRAGWLLEDLTFNNFGFSGIHLPSDEIADFIKVNFPSYFSANQKKISAADADELRNLVLQLSIKEAKQWWSGLNGSFSRLSALNNALKSTDEKRQVKALYYIRNGISKCSGLTKDVYYDQLSKEIVRLSGSDVQRISENAKLILLDTRLEWLSIKPN